MILPRFLAALLALLALPGLASAQDDPPRPWEGVWRGTIGAYPVTACLQRDGLGTPKGAYYYLTKRVPIRLEFDEASGTWHEDSAREHHDAPTWSLSPAAQDRLGGTWHQEGRELPVALARVAIEADASPCGARAFMAPRLGTVTITRAPHRQAGLEYDTLTYNVGAQFESVAISSFALKPALPGDTAINRAVALDPLKPGSEADFAECLSGSIDSLGMDGDFSLSLDPQAVAGEYLSVLVSNGYFCGGAHPDAFDVYRVFDRRDGREIDLWSWLGPRATVATSEPPDGPTREMAPALRRLALRHLASMDRECRDVVRDTEWWSIGLVDKGISFAPSLPHVAQACGDNAVVPWKALAPWLSAQGKAAQARMARKRG